MVMSVGYQLTLSIRLEIFHNWGVISAFGMILILASAYLERNQQRVMGLWKIALHQWKNMEPSSPSA
jgi:hypothetical protein